MSDIENLIESYRQDDSTISNENVGYLAKEIEKVIAQQVKEARLDELSKYCKFINGKPEDSIIFATELVDRYLDRIATLEGDDK